MAKVERRMPIIGLLVSTKNGTHQNVDLIFVLEHIGRASGHSLVPEVNAMEKRGDQRGFPTAYGRQTIQTMKS